MSDAIKKLIINQAKNFGFDTVGFCKADLPINASENLSEFLEKNYHGEMGWLKDRAELRASPANLWQDAKTVIMLGHNYSPNQNPLHRLSLKNIGNISCYAQNEDYHDVIKKKLKQLAGFIATEHGCEVKVFVDTAPVMEKPLAQQAGIGWQGKHTCVVSREFGSWLFLGAIFTTLELVEDKVEKDHCGSCTQCLDICPTNAFVGVRQIDARKCISYLTIEHKGQIPIEYRKVIGNRIYGCDDCLAVCPWNKFAQEAKESAYHARSELESPLLKDLLVLDDAGFRSMFRKSPVKRIGRDRFVRNVLIAAGNSEDKSLISVIEQLKNDGSELVSEMAWWALKQLNSHT